jgi:hypothetical protein
MRQYGQKGKKGFAKHSYGTQRHRLSHRKGKGKSKKSPAAPPPPPQLQTNADTIQLLVGGPSDNNIQSNLNGWFGSGSSSALPAARQYLPRASKMGPTILLEQVDDDDEEYKKHVQKLEDETIRHWILAQYVGVLGAPDQDDWEDYAGGLGTISLIEKAGGDMKESLLFRKQIRRTLNKIKDCWEKGEDYCPKKDTSKLN